MKRNQSCRRGHSRSRSSSFLKLSMRELKIDIFIFLISRSSSSLELLKRATKNRNRLCVCSGMLGVGLGLLVEDWRTRKGRIIICKETLPEGLRKHLQKQREEMSDSKRMVKLFCPSLSKVAQLVADDNHRLDIGSIAQTFGLEPATVKFNGHFISRGLDLIASSVTWKSLISFFSSRGLSTGTTGSGALVIDGKLSKSGSKRLGSNVNSILVVNVRTNLSHTSSVTGTRSRRIDAIHGRVEIIKGGEPGTHDSVNGILSMSDRRPPLEIKKPKLKDSDDVDKGSGRHLISNALKRKQEEDATSYPSLKRLKVDESGSQYTCSETLPKRQVPCSFLSVNMKRTREDEMLLPVSCKKIR